MTYTEIQVELVVQSATLNAVAELDPEDFPDNSAKTYLERVWQMLDSVPHKLIMLKEEVENILEELNA